MRKKLEEGDFFSGFSSTVTPSEVQAFDFACERHSGQNRPGGEPQEQHVHRVFGRASVAANKEGLMPYQAYVLLAAAALHDVLEDTKTTRREISRLFGRDVARVVQALTHESEEESDEVYLRRVAAGGRLAVIVKRCDRLDNLNTLRRAPPDFRKRKLAEIRAALPLWHEIDPDGAVLIEELLQEVEQHATAC